MSCGRDDGVPGGGVPGGGCRRTPAVLALYLDGDIGLPADDGRDATGCGDESGFDFVCPETLANHLRECLLCQRELQRARRLDAMLAEGSGRVLASHLASEQSIDALCARWFASEQYAVPRGAEAGTPQAVTSDLGHSDLGHSDLAHSDLGHSDLGHSDLGHSDVAASDPAPSDADAVPGHLLAMAGADGEPRGGGVPPARATAWHHHTALLAASLGGLLLVATGWYLGCHLGQRQDRGQRELAQRTPGATAEVAQAAPAPGAPPVAAASQVTSAPPEPPQAASPGRTPKLANDAAAPRRRYEVAPLPIDTAVELRRLADPSAIPGVRVAAAKLLLLAARPGMPKATTTLSDLLATLAAGAGEGLAAVHGALRQEPHFLAHLRSCLQRLEAPQRQADLQDLAAFTVAARLDQRELDLAVQRLVRRRPELADTLAAALRSGSRSRGAAQLLLDAWSDLAERGDRQDEDRLAPRWFDGQPLAMFAEVATELATTRSAPRRVRCLLALGSCPQPLHVEALVVWSGTGCRSEAYAAAFALAKAPSGWLRPLVARAAQDRDAFLLRAALARAELPEASAWVEPLALPPADRELLAHGSLLQFPAVAAWFRDRAPLGD